MQQHGNKYFARIQPQTLGMGSIGQSSTFSEYGHGAYQIKENHKCSNMVANILPEDHPPPTLPPPTTLGIGSTGQNSTFSEHGHVAYIKLNGITKCSNMVANILPPPPMPLTQSIGQKSTFSEHCHVTSRRMQQHGSKYFMCTSPSPQDPRVWGPKVKIQLFQNMIMLHIKLKGIMNAATW